MPSVPLQDKAPANGRHEGAVRLKWPVAVFVGAVVVATGGLWIVHHPWSASLDWLGLVALALLTGAAQTLAIDIYGRGRVSTSAIIVLAGAILFGMPGALLLAPVIPLAVWVVHRGILYRSLSDLGTITLSGAAAAVVYQDMSTRLPGAEQFIPAGPILLLVPAGLAALAYYVVNVGLVSLVMGFSEKQSIIGIWNERFRWLLPHYLVFGALALLIALAYQAIGVYGLFSFFVPPVMLRYVMKQYIDRTVENVAELKRVNDELVKAHGEVVSTLKELQATYDVTLTALSTALDSRDSETEGHCRRVVEYVTVIAKELGFPESDLHGLIQGARLHDVGKIGVPDAILRKPQQLTPAEWTIMKTHSEQGYRVLRDIKFLSAALPVVRHHHERFDGGGYPQGLRGSEIPLGARIFAVADAFDAMTSDRPYRAARSRAAAREEIGRCAGSQFDPEIVEAFLRVYDREWALLSDQPAQGGEASSAQVGQDARPKQTAVPIPFPAV